MLQAAEAGDERFDPKSGSEYIPTEDTSPGAVNRQKIKKDLDRLM
jgi:hypothetical protein